MKVEWISVEDRLPYDSQAVLAWFPNPPGNGDYISDWESHCCVKARFNRFDKRTKGWFDTAEFEDLCDLLAPKKHITHWMPLPPGPNKNVKK